MSDNVQTVLGLPEKNEEIDPSPMIQEFGDMFRQALAGVNENMQVVAAQGTQQQHTLLDEQRGKLVEAYQTTTKRLESSNSEKNGEQDVSRVIDAVKAVAGKVAAVATDALSFRDQWLARQSEFDAAVDKITELDVAEHAKAPALKKIADAILSRVDEKVFAEAMTTLDSLLPKLDQIYEDYQGKQAAGAGTVEGFFAELESLERAVEQFMVENGMQV